MSETFKMVKINGTCPKCGKSDYLYHLSGINVCDINVKCTNCNAYYRLEELQDRQQFASDTISRQAARDIVYRSFADMHTANRDRLAEIDYGLLDLPSAQPERKTGRWIFNQYDANPRIGNWHCSECGQITIMPHDVCNYCPNCGAKMEVEHDSW